MAVHIADFLTTPAWVIGGIFLWRRKEFGYVVGLALLFQLSMLFIGLIVFLLIKPTFTGTPFAAVDVIAVVIMGMTCFIPFTMFICRMISKSSQKNKIV